MKMIKLALGFIMTNTYIIGSEGNNAAVIDPGFDADNILSVAEKENLKVIKILLTHGHFDHIGAVKAIHEKTNAPIYIHKADAEMLTDLKKNCGIYHSANDKNDYIIQSPANALDDEDIIELDELRFKAVHTPGHTKGSCIYILNDMIFTGDTLFYESVGRTDLYGGSGPVLANSLGFFKKLEGEYQIYPGHGEKTTLSHELKYNKWLV